MDFFTLALIAALAAYMLKTKDEKARIHLLGSHLGKYQIEKVMETLTDGYLRAMGEAEPERRAQVWAQLATSEEKLCNQFDNFTAGFAKVPEADARVSTLPIGLPYGAKLFPKATFDMRKMLAIHAQGLRTVSENSAGRSPRDKAFMLSAEMFLMQHSCHWFCKSRTVASARLLMRHRTPYEQLLASVSPATRKAYAGLTGQ